MTTPCERKMEACGERKSASSKHRPAAASVGDVRERVAELLADQESAHAVLSVIDALVNERDALAAEHARQGLRIKQLLHLLYGRRTEKLTKNELYQLALAFGASEEEAAKEVPEVPRPQAPSEGDAESDSQPGSPPPNGGKTGKKRRVRRARTIVDAEVERLIVDVPVPADERNCTCCHDEMEVVGFVEHSTLEYEPAKIIEHIERREKRACRRSDCRGDIHAAPRMQDNSERRNVGTSLLAHLVDAKCNDALPIDRQRDQFERLGVSFPLNTLYSYWTYVTTLLLPVAKVVLATVLGDDIVGVDDTKLRVLDRKRPQGSYKGCLWCFTGTGTLVAYTFTESWEADKIAPHIGAISGFIQCDDYKGYASLVTMPDGVKRVLVDPERRLGCLMHVRRGFHGAVKLGDKRALHAIELIHDLYEVEAEAKQHGLGPTERLALRQERSLPLLKQFDDWVDGTKPKCTPKSPLAVALGYAAQQRPFIRRCFTDGRFEIDNGNTERAIRRPCIGRNNYLFTGSPAAAERLAGAYTLVQSCRNSGIVPRQYLLDVITKLEAGWPLRQIGELVPDRWAALHGPLALRDQAAQ